MTVAELIEHLQKLDPTLPVYVGDHKILPARPPSTVRFYDGTLAVEIIQTRNSAFSRPSSQG